MHDLLTRQLKRIGFDDPQTAGEGSRWAALLPMIVSAYEQADQDRYLLERSLELSSEEMLELHAALKSERDSISTVIESLREGVCAIDPDGRIVHLNPEARRLLAIPPERPVAGQLLADLTEAQAVDGRHLASLCSAHACESDPPHDDQAIEPQLIVPALPHLHITYDVSRLGDGEGTVVTLRDATLRHRLEAEGRALNAKLVDMSRQAGMAEVATEVLHNVGNVLNSINVSATIASDVVRDTRIDGVHKVADLIDRSPADELDTARIATYLRRLHEELHDERRRIDDELAGLRRSVDLIRDIVTAQQTYAKVGGMDETIAVDTLIDESLRIVGAGLDRHEVRFEWTPNPDRVVHVERHQVMQVLVNLINNAKHAVADEPVSRRTISIDVTDAPDPQWVAISVADTGCGIAQEDLTRIFSHGFTTRRDGHGFGLHSAALSARSMGGSLRAESDGVSQGARFVLELPIARMGMSTSPDAPRRRAG